MDPIDLKYRPSSFVQLLGQPVVARVLSKLVQRGAHRHVVLHGPTGTGKTSAGRLYGRALNCAAATETGSPCNGCESCLAILTKAHPDHLEIDASTTGGKQEIARLVEIARAAPLSGRFRVIQVEEAQDLSKEAWDTLLLILEEPPPHLVFIFTTTQRRKVPDEVAQRALELETKLLAPADVLAHLTHVCEAEGLVADAEALKLLAFLGRGHARGTLTKLEKVTLYGDITVENVRECFGLGYLHDLLSVWSGLAGGDLAKAVEAVSRWNDSPSAILEIWREFLLFLQGKFVYRTPLVVNPLFDAIPSADLRRVMTALTERASGSGLEAEDVFSALNKVLAAAAAPTDLALRLLVCDLHTLINRHHFDATRMGRPAPVAGGAVVPQGKAKTGRQFSRAYLEADGRGVAAPVPGVTPAASQPTFTPAQPAAPIPMQGPIFQLPPASPLPQPITTATASTFVSPPAAPSPAEVEDEAGPLVPAGMLRGAFAPPADFVLTPVGSL